MDQVSRVRRGPKVSTGVRRYHIDMKPRYDHLPAGADAFTGDLQSRLDIVRDRVGAESVHLDQVEAVAASYTAALPPPLRLVR
jgi:hypothetical protein